MEEAKEFVERLESGENLPLFTSCCPAWVKFCENRYPNLRRHISTCRSPQEMFGALIKEEARMDTEDTRKTMVVSIMPCTAKKAETLRPEHYTDGEQNVDLVLTTTEITRMIKEAGIDMSQMPSEALDMPFGLSSGAGRDLRRHRRCDGSRCCGGSSTAALRKTSKGSALPESAEPTASRRRRFRFRDGSLSWRWVNGLRNADELMKKIESGEVYYDFVEVMACKRGCMAGGGQPVPIGPRTKKASI